MAKSRTSRSKKASSKAKAAPRKQAASRKQAAPKQAGKRQQPGAAHLHQLIEQLMDAKQRGDYAAGEKAAAALAAFHKRPAAAEVRQAAAEARAVAGNAVMVESLRLLGNIAARLRPAAS